MVVLVLAAGLVTCASDAGVLLVGQDVAGSDPEVQAPIRVPTTRARPAREPMTLSLAPPDGGARPRVS